MNPRASSEVNEVRQQLTDLFVLGHATKKKLGIREKGCRVLRGM